MLNNHFIKKMLLANKFKVYSIIVNSYYEEIEKLKLSVFREWLANELDIEVEKINPSSLNSALARQRNKLKKQEKNTAATKTITRPGVQRTSFPFSKEDELSQKQNIVEM